jgi:hypothetical protein
MSIGTAIFLSSLVLATVILYGITKDRWRWRRIVARTALTLALFALATIVVLSAIAIGRYYYETSTKPLVPQTEPLVPQTEYAGLRLGMSPDEVMYIKGYPSNVVDETPKQNPFDAFINTKDLKQGERVQDYREWLYENNQQGSIGVTFNPEKTAVVVIECLSFDRLRRCPSIAGVSHGDSEQEVIQKLGSPDVSRIEGLNKYLTYRPLGLQLSLTKEQIFGLSINDPKYKRTRR